MRLSIDAANKLAEDNLGLVFGFLKLRQAWAQRNGLDADEVQELATLALVRASRGFDPDRGIRFSTYAYRAMGCALSREVKLRQRRRCVGITPTDQPSSQAAETRPHPGPGQLEALDFIAAAWPKLTAQQHTVLRGRFWDDRTLDDIGREMGVTRERVRQIEAAALAACRRLIAA